MGANAQTTVPTFTAGQVLTADQQNQSARTGVPVFAGTVERDAAFGGSGEKTLAEGQLCYLESTNVVQYYDGAAWATVGPSTGSGLTLISSTTIGTTVSSVTVSNAFSSTYDRYLITLTGGVASTINTARMTLGSTTSGYYAGRNYNTFASATTTAVNQSNAAYWEVGGGTTNALHAQVFLDNPNAAKVSIMTVNFVNTATNGESQQGGGFLNDTTQYTAFTLTASTGTWTGGFVRVYGLANS